MSRAETVALIAATIAVLIALNLIVDRHPLLTLVTIAGAGAVGYVLAHTMGWTRPKEKETEGEGFEPPRPPREE